MVVVEVGWGVRGSTTRMSGSNSTVRARRIGTNLLCAGTGRRRQDACDRLSHRVCVCLAAVAVGTLHPPVKSPVQDCRVTACMPENTARATGAGRRYDTHTPRR